MVNYKTTEYFSNLANNKPHLQKQFIPDPREKILQPYENTDPLLEENYKVCEKLIHRYKNRVLLLVTNNCALFCRHCFRGDFVNRKIEIITDKQLADACNYIKENKEVEEILISGGDPLTLNTGLEKILNSILDARPDILIRIGARLPIVDPLKITVEFCNIFKGKNIWMSLQCNHPDELTPEVKTAVNNLLDSGVSLVNQSVLLKDVNDSPLVLASLSKKLLEFRIKPYYIFQGDLAPGTGHLRVSIERGMEIIKALRPLVSGLGMPLYAVDIPGGGGKVPITRDFITGEDSKYIYFTNSSGFTGSYPKE